MNDDFYVGYFPRAPHALGRRMTRVVAGLLFGGLAVGAALILNQSPFANSKFEYGVDHEYSGVIEEWPYPILRTRDASFLLVAPGKHGLSGSIQGLQGKTVALKASLIERLPYRMLEVRPDSLRVTAAAQTQLPNHFASLGPVKLRGEIVDSKCYLGVMNPGDGKVHRDCAVRCISGGAPPAFIARDAKGETRVLLLVGANGRQLNQEILSFIAEPLEISGELLRKDSSLILKAEPATFRRQSE